MGEGPVQASVYQMLPDMPSEQYEALKADIAERGVLTPIDVDELGNILDGHHRHRACVELGINDYPSIVRPGLSEAEKRLFARKANALRRHLTRAQLREIIAAQMKETPTWANNRIASELGTDGKTVAAMRESLEATSEIPKLDRLVGADGKERPVKRRASAILASNVGELERILKELHRIDTTTITELAGFFSEGGFGAAIATFTTPNYNPFAGRSDAEIAEWKRFAEFIADADEQALEGAARHVEWLLQRPFQNVSEWLGEAGRRFRARCGMKQPSPTFQKAWETHNRTFDSADTTLMESAGA